MNKERDSAEQSSSEECSMKELDYLKEDTYLELSTILGEYTAANSRIMEKGTIGRIKKPTVFQDFLNTPFPEWAATGEPGLKREMDSVIDPRCILGGLSGLEDEMFEDHSAYLDADPEFHYIKMIAGIEDENSHEKILEKIYGELQKEATEKEYEKEWVKIEEKKEEGKIEEGKVEEKVEESTLEEKVKESTLEEPVLESTEEEDKVQQGCCKRGSSKNKSKKKEQPKIEIPETQETEEKDKNLAVNPTNRNLKTTENSTREDCSSEDEKEFRKLMEEITEKNQSRHSVSTVTNQNEESSSVPTETHSSNLSPDEIYSLMKSDYSNETISATPPEAMNLISNSTISSLDSTESGNASKQKKRKKSMLTKLFSKNKKQ